MKILKYSVFVIVLLSIVGCDEDRFSSVKTIDFPEHESVLAVTSNINVSADGFAQPRAFVSHSLGIVDQSDYTEIGNATVELFKNGTLFSNLEHLEKGQYFGQIGQELTDGTYTLKVSAPNYDPIEATQVLPSKAEVISATYEFEKVPFDFEEDLYDLMKVKIKDPEGEENYYAFDLYFEVKRSNGTISQRHAYTGSDDPLIEAGYSFDNILPDISFNGNTFETRLIQQSKWEVQDNEELIAANVLVYSLTKDLYIYDRSRLLNQDAEDNPFAEPVLVHSNFDGGYGVFTLSNVTKYRHEF